MRRWIFAALVLANLGLLMWGVFYLDTERAETSEPPPDIAPEKMRPLDKRESARRRSTFPRSAEAESKPVALATPNVEEASRCLVIGPLPEGAPLQRVEQGLAGIAHSQRQETARVAVGYRVYLPSFPSREEAERKRRELSALGFTDHALLQEEGFQNALSLGLFSVAENAQSRIQSLTEKGVTAKIHTLEQERAVYWIDIGPADSTAELRTRLKDLLDGIAGAELRESTCTASAGK